MPVTFGRLGQVALEHPSCSRHHALLKRENDAWWIQDEGSVHGTRLNKELIPPKQWIRMASGDQLRFGESTRIYILEEEKKQPFEEVSTRKKPRAVSTHVEGTMMEFSDPKRTLQEWFDQQGRTLQYKVQLEGLENERQYVVSIELVQGEDGRMVHAQATSMRRRDAEKEAALDACRKLQQMNLLYTDQDYATAMAQDRSRLKRLLGDANDEDDFYDMASQAKKRREFDTAPPDIERQHLLDEINKIKSDLAIMQACSNDDLADPLDAFMSSLSTSQPSQASLQAKLSDLQSRLDALGHPPTRMQVSPTTPPPFEKQQPDESDEWLPPSHQTGSGASHLNEKLGY